MMFHDIMKCVSGACCAAVMMCCGGDLRGMGDEKMKTEKRSTCVLPPSYDAIEASLDRSRACSTLDIRSVLSLEELETVLEQLACYSRLWRFKKQKDIDLNFTCFHIPFSLLFTKHWDQICAMISNKLLGEKSLLNLMDIVHVLPEAIKKPYDSDPGLTVEISKIAENTHSVSDLINPDSIDIFKKYGRYLDQIVEAKYSDC